MKMSKLIIEEIDAYKKHSTFISAYPTGIVKIIHGKKIIYIMPYGVDYECEGGHFCQQLTEEEFNKAFSLMKG